MRTIVHVNQHVIKANGKTGDRNPPMTVKNYKTNEYGHTISVLDKEGEIVGQFIYRPDKPLACGAKVWFETQYGVLVD